MNPLVAATYDDSVAEQFTAEAIGSAVDALADLAGDGPAVEFAVGTGRVALPLAETGIAVHGIDSSEPMLAELRKKRGAERVSLGETIVPFDVSEHHLGFEEYVDRVNQISISHHYFIDGDRVRTSSPAFRYVWPSELDLMAELAAMTLESRWADWRRSPFTIDSQSHVSVWRKH